MFSTWGPVAAESASYDFDSTTHYYAEEMGKRLNKWIVAFRDPIFPDQLPDIKLTSNAMEQVWLSVDGRRRVNIDPGYLSPINLVLASGKNASYRIYLRDGIYAEITLRYQHGSYTPLDSTYPDYRQPEVIAFFNSQRSRALEARRSGK